MKNAVVCDQPEIVIPGRAIGYKQASYLKKGWIINDDHYLNWYFSNTKIGEIGVS
jgi:hypothetical protein